MTDKAISPLRRRLIEDMTIRRLSGERRARPAGILNFTLCARVRATHRK